jgi:hypothetical protein
MTAVEWLRNRFYFHADQTHPDYNSWDITEEDFEKIITEALELEKQQIMKAFADGFANTDNGLQYYETIKNNDLKIERIAEMTEREYYETLKNETK